MDRLLLMTGICVFIGTFTACNFMLWFQEAEVVTEAILDVEKEVNYEYDVYRQEPYIHENDTIDQLLHKDKLSRWAIDP